MRCRRALIYAGPCESFSLNGRSLSELINEKHPACMRGEPADSRSGRPPRVGISGHQVSQQLSGELLRLTRSDDDSVGALLVAGRQIDRIFDVWIDMEGGRRDRGCFRTDSRGETARLAHLVTQRKVDCLLRR